MVEAPAVADHTDGTLTYKLRPSQALFTILRDDPGLVHRISSANHILPVCFLRSVHGE